MKLKKIDEVATEFINTFEEGEATVWGLTIIVIEEQIAEVTGLTPVGEHYPNVHDARSTRAQFFLSGDPPLDIIK